MPVITLPDGSHRSFAESVTVHDVAADIGAGLAKAALAGKVDGKLVDTSHRIEQDAELAIITERDEDGVDVKSCGWYLQASHPPFRQELLWRGQHQYRRQ